MDKTLEQRIAELEQREATQGDALTAHALAELGAQVFVLIGTVADISERVKVLEIVADNPQGVADSPQG